MVHFFAFAFCIHCDSTEPMIGVNAHYTSLTFSLEELIHPIFCQTNVLFLTFKLCIRERQDSSGICFGCQQDWHFTGFSILVFLFWVWFFWANYSVKKNILNKKMLQKNNNIQVQCSNVIYKQWRIRKIQSF